MSRPRRRAFNVVAFCAASALASSAVAVPIYGGLTYDIASGEGYVLLPDAEQPRRPTSDGVAVGNADKHVGGSVIGTPRPFRITPAGAAELDPAIVDGGYVRAVNRAGVATGEAARLGAAGAAGVAAGAFRWHPDGSVEELRGFDDVDRPGRTTLPYVAAINDAGTVVGVAEKYGPHTPGGTSYSFSKRPLRWDPGSGVGVELLATGMSGVSSQSFQLVGVNGAARSPATSRANSPAAAC